MSANNLFILKRWTKYYFSCFFTTFWLFSMFYHTKSYSESIPGTYLFLWAWVHDLWQVRQGGMPKNIPGLPLAFTTFNRCLITLWLCKTSLWSSLQLMSPALVYWTEYCIQGNMEYAQNCGLLSKWSFMVGAQISCHTQCFTQTAEVRSRHILPANKGKVVWTFI